MALARDTQHEKITLAMEGEIFLMSFHMCTKVILIIRYPKLKCSESDYIRLESKEQLQELQDKGVINKFSP